MENKLIAAPVVKSPGTRKWRIGRGFSAGELKTVGLTVKQAQQLGFPVDTRRKSIHSENVRTLKSLTEDQ